MVHEERFQGRRCVLEVDFSFKSLIVSGEGEREVTMFILLVDQMISYSKHSGQVCSS